MLKEDYIATDVPVLSKDLNSHSTAVVSIALHFFYKATHSVSLQKAVGGFIVIKVVKTF